MPAPSVIERSLIFSVHDADRAWVRVSLDCDDAVLGRRRFRRTAGGWGLVLPRPALERLEYRLVVTAADGTTAVICDPGNPNRVATVFGDRSVALLPGYRAPAWLRTPAGRGRLTSVRFRADGLGELPITVWSPTGLTRRTPAPLLVVHDGPEYARLAALTTYAAAVVADGRLPPFRAALLHPVQRDAWYSANPEYVGAEIGALGAIGAAFAVREPAVAMGASLGALTALLVALAAQPRFGGAFLQSGSFFTPELDEQERSYPYFSRIAAAVADVVGGPPTTHPLVVGLTCGALEENHADNLAMAKALRALGHGVSFDSRADLHNYTAWRDALDPCLTDVLREVWKR
ncbi:MAG TPA: alpha/beta hydrolase-fold protein [Nocardioidaceae bacterium]|nr:alpha/beta hydrolase-fold protein [Nocardioidaceae bacterium]